MLLPDLSKMTSEGIPERATITVDSVDNGAMALMCSSPMQLESGALVAAGQWHHFFLPAGTSIRVRDQNGLGGVVSIAPLVEVPHV